MPSGFMQVCVPVPGLQPLTYAWEGASSPAVGARVLVPLGRRTVTGVVFESPPLAAPTDAKKIKPMLRLLDPHPILTPELLRLGTWLADYYQCSLGEALGAMLPMVPLASSEPAYQPAAIMPKNYKPSKIANLLLDRLGAARMPESRLLEGLPKGFRRALEVLVKRGAVLETEIDEEHEMVQRPSWPCPADGLPLTSEQQACLKEIQAHIQPAHFWVGLLHGVTGSGKTEVYMQAMAQTLNAGRQAILLLPEIALSTQMQTRFLERFPGQVGIMHSQLPAKTKLHMWRAARQGRIPILIGPRSAVFAPMPKLGFLVVDEEFDSSYKQEEAPRYHARDVAVMRGKMEGCPVLLGSATPAIESYYNARQGRYRLLEISTRVDGRALPEIEMVDMVEVNQGRAHWEWHSPQALNALREHLERKEQSLIFLNRRGYAPVVLCPDCRHIRQCDDCAVRLVYHAADDQLHCHVCGKKYPARAACPRCGRAMIRLSGWGTQRLAEALQGQFPGARILRMDHDQARNNKRAEAMLESFRSGGADILIGTQMIAKGLHFPGLTLVVVVSADTFLNFPDFRAEERTFQLLVQVAGRAGRGEKPGRVILQTMRAQRPALQLAAQQDYARFYEQEIIARQELGYPPFGKLASLRVSGRQPERVVSAAHTLAAALRSARLPETEILGPAPFYYEKIKRDHRYHVFVRSRQHAGRQQLVARARALVLPSGVHLAVDIDPQNML